jgi:DnaK suppressor protein
VTRVSHQLNKTEVQSFRALLERERQETIRFLVQLEEERRVVVSEDEGRDLGDLCELNLSRESLFERTSQKRQHLNRLTIALHRIDSGRFGLCDECGELISRKRLEAMPWASLCVRCQEEMEEVWNSRRTA